MKLSLILILAALVGCNSSDHRNPGVSKPLPPQDPAKPCAASPATDNGMTLQRAQDGAFVFLNLAQNPRWWLVNVESAKRLEQQADNLKKDDLVACERFAVGYGNAVTCGLTDSSDYGDTVLLHCYQAVALQLTRNVLKDLGCGKGGGEFKVESMFFAFEVREKSRPPIRVIRVTPTK